MKKFSFIMAGFFFCIIFNGGVLANQDPLVVLGKLVFEDPDFSANGNQSCQSCHHPDAQFSDPVNRISPMYRPVSEGSIHGEFGTRNAPPAAYASFSPVFDYDTVEGLFFGGLFWDGRATGRTDITDTGGLGNGPTGDPLADQAKGPFGNPVEMALPIDPLNSVEEEVVSIVAGKYSAEYEDAFEHDINTIDVRDAYDNIALAISAFEKSSELNRFTSKFDHFRDEQGGDVSTFISVPAGFTSDVYTQAEAEGLALFNGKAQCNACHPTANIDANTPSVFTDFSYDNLGIPTNPTIMSLKGVKVSIDYGLGAQVEILTKAAGEVDLGKIKKIDDQVVVESEMGKFKVSSLRNIAKTAPYGHNGFFPTLYDIVHFYNTRDVKEVDWPKPEVPENVNTAELGDLGLTFEEEQKIVLFLETLTDDK